MLALPATRNQVALTTMPALPRITTPVRELDEALWSLLLKPGPLSAEEWALIEARERAWSE